MTRKQLLKVNNGGFTLVELLLVVALMAISFGVTSDILITLMRSFSKTTVVNEIEQQAGVAAQMMEKEIKNAATVTLNGNTLQVEDTAGVRIFYRWENYNGIGALYRYPCLNPPTCTLPDMSTVANRRNYSISGSPQIHTNLIGGVNVTCPTGACFTVDSSARPTIVRIELNFAQAQATINTSFAGNVRISNTIVVRNTY